MKEKNYIRYRKVKALGISIRFYFCRIFRIRKKRIAVCTFEGKGGFGCNPKYIVEELHKQDSSYEIIWLVNDMSREFPEYIKKAPNTPWSRAYWLSTSKIWIDNYRTPYGTRKRKGQYYINVNHYTIGFKCTGLWRGKGFSHMAYLVSKNDSDMIDELVIDSAWCEQAFNKGLVYEGSFLKTGAPRCDVLFGDRSMKKEDFRIKHSLPDDAKVVMFAPTFREDSQNGVRNVFSEIWSIDFRRLINSLEKKFGGIWYLCVRVHPQLAPTFQKYKNPEIQERLIDESQADDMYEILAGMDAYITDYSSAAFEAGFAKIPVFIYADDIEKYVHDRGNLMWNFVTDPHNCVKNNKEMTPKLDVVMPFSIAVNNEELEKNITEFDETKYSRKIDDFIQQAGVVFDGGASKKLTKYIMDLGDTEID